MTGQSDFVQVAGADAQNGKQIYEAVLRQLQSCTPQLLDGTQLYQRTDATRLMPVGCDRCACWNPCYIEIANKRLDSAVVCWYLGGSMSRGVTYASLLSSPAAAELVPKLLLVLLPAAWMPCWQAVCGRQQSPSLQERHALASHR